MKKFVCPSIHIQIFGEENIVTVSGELANWAQNHTTEGSVPVTKNVEFTETIKYIF